MDASDLGAADHRQALAGLARINTLSLVCRQLWSRLEPLARRQGSLSLLDLGTGLGDVPLGLARSAQRLGVRVSVSAVDFSPCASELAQQRALEANVPWRSVVHDLTSAPLPIADQSVDATICTLVLHHLSELHAVTLLREVARVSRHRVLVSDLRRSRRGLLAAHIAGRTLTRSRVVRVDAVRSVHNAFTTGEMRSMAVRAGLRQFEVRPMWPFRMILDATTTP